MDCSPEWPQNSPTPSRRAPHFLISLNLIYNYWPWTSLFHHPNNIFLFCPTLCPFFSYPISSSNLIYSLYGTQSPVTSWKRYRGDTRFENLLVWKYPFFFFFTSFIVWMVLQVCWTLYLSLKIWRPLLPVLLVRSFRSLESHFYMYYYFILSLGFQDFLFVSGVLENKYLSVWCYLKYVTSIY